MGNLILFAVSFVTVFSLLNHYKVGQDTFPKKNNAGIVGEKDLAKEGGNTKASSNDEYEPISFNEDKQISNKKSISTKKTASTKLKASTNSVSASSSKATSKPIKGLW